MWFDTEAVPLERIEELPYRFENTALIDATPARVFQIWAEGHGQAEWFQDFVACRWTTAHRGVGAEREIELKVLTVKERFLVWEPGKRMTFVIYAITLPLLTAMVEDMTFTPVTMGDPERVPQTPPGDAGTATRTRFHWVVRYRPTTLMRLVHPVARMIFASMFRATTEKLTRWAKAHPG